MLFFNINILNGSEDDADILKDCLVEWDDCFEEDDPSLTVEVEELYGHFDDLEEMEELAVSIADALPNSEFTIDGYVDTSEQAGEYMSFLIEYKNSLLTTKSSCWYVRMHAEDYDDYDDFAEAYQDENGEPRFTEDQFEMFKDNEYYILDSGDGDCVQEVPLSNVDVFEMNR